MRGNRIGYDSVMRKVPLPYVTKKVQRFGPLIVLMPSIFLLNYFISLFIQLSDILLLSYRSYDSDYLLQRFHICRLQCSLDSRDDRRSM